MMIVCDTKVRVLGSVKKQILICSIIKNAGRVQNPACVECEKIVFKPLPALNALKLLKLASYRPCGSNILPEI
jgi:hypothetical protein